MKPCHPDRSSRSERSGGTCIPSGATPILGSLLRTPTVQNRTPPSHFRTTHHKRLQHFQPLTPAPELLHSRRREECETCFRTSATRCASFASRQALPPSSSSRSRSASEPTPRCSA